MATWITSLLSLPYLAMAHSLPVSCPKCGCESAGDPERVWKGPKYRPHGFTHRMNGVPERIPVPEALEYECLRCGYTIERPCLDAS